METQTIEVKKKDAMTESFDKMYNLAIDHSIDTVRNFFPQSPELAEMLIEKLQALKS